MKKETVTGKYGKQSGKNKNIYNVYGRAHKDFCCSWCGIRIANCSVTTNGLDATYPFCTWTCGWRYGRHMLGELREGRIKPSQLLFYPGTQEVGQDRIASPLKRLKIVFGDDHFLQGGHAIRERVVVIEYALGDKAADQGEPGEE